MRRFGFSLVGVLWLVALLVTLQLGVISVVGQARERVSEHKLAQSAHWMAVSGADYAEGMIRSGDWRKPLDFRSPELPGGHFEVQLKTAGGHWEIRSVGVSGTFRHQLNRRVEK